MTSGLEENVRMLTYMNILLLVIADSKLLEVHLAKVGKNLVAKTTGKLLGIATVSIHEGEAIFL